MKLIETQGQHFEGFIFQTESKVIKVRGLRYGMLQLENIDIDRRN